MEEQNKEKAIMDITVEFNIASYRHYNFFRLRRWQSLLAISLTVFFVFSLLIYFGDPAHWIASAIFLGASCISIAYSALSGKEAARIMMETRPLPTTYTFYENALCTQGGAMFVQTWERLEYALFSKCYETRHAFYMTAPRRAAIILDKSFFGEAETTMLRSLFARKFEKNFKQYKQK